MVKKYVLDYFKDVCREFIARIFENFPFLHENYGLCFDFKNFVLFVYPRRSVDYFEIVFYTYPPDVIDFYTRSPIYKVVTGENIIIYVLDEVDFWKGPLSMEKMIYFPNAERMYLLQTHVQFYHESYINEISKKVNTLINIVKEFNEDSIVKCKCFLTFYKCSRYVHHEKCIEEILSILDLIGDEKLIKNIQTTLTFMKNILILTKNVLNEVEKVNIDEVMNNIDIPINILKNKTMIKKVQTLIKWIVTIQILTKLI